MSDFVDYNKRGITLPEGCKDLTDLFAASLPSTVVLNFQSEIARKAAHLSKSPKFEIVRSESGSVSIHEIEAKLRAVYESPAAVSSLSLDASRVETFQFSLMRMRDASLKSFHGVLSIGRASVEHRTAVYRVFAEHGLKPRVSENFSICKPEASPEILFSIVPVPDDAGAFAKLIVALYQEMVDGPEEALLGFTYKELRPEG